MFLNIITPCSRFYNLHSIADSINIPPSDYRWIVVFDAINLPNSYYIPKNCEPYFYYDKDSIFGNAQRNFGLSLINDGHIYFNDDDTALHPELWNNINQLNKYDFIFFKQINSDGIPRLVNNYVQINYIDSHNFIVSNKTARHFKWTNKYNSDGIFATQCYAKSSHSIFIDKYLSVYNSLR